MFEYVPTDILLSLPMIQYFWVWKKPIVFIVGQKKAIGKLEILPGFDDIAISVHNNDKPVKIFSNSKLDQFQRRVLCTSEFEILETGNYRMDIIRKESIKSFHVKIDLKKTDMTILLLSDNQNGPFVFTRLLQLAKRMSDFDLILHGGDATQLPFHPSHWQNYFFDPLHATGWGNVPIIYTHGNHEFWRNYLSPYIPKERFFGLSLGGNLMKIIILDSNTLDDGQRDWFYRELEASVNHYFILVSIHIAPYIEYWDDWSWNGPRQEKEYPINSRKFIDETRKRWENSKSSRFPIDIIISGHQHNYQRGYKDGIVYCIFGGAGGRTDHFKVENCGIYTTTFLDHHFVKLNIFKDEIQDQEAIFIWEAFDLLGNSVDRIEMRRDLID